MKKSTTLFLLLMYLNAFSQTDCSNAIRIINSHNYTPSAGNPIASGPFYDCIDPASGLSATWFTLLACKSASSESIHINASSDSLYAVIWGPFSSSLNSCNQLTQTNMIDCDYEVWYQWVLPSLSLHLTNIQAGDIYYIMVASGDSINGIEIGLNSPGSISPFTGICGLCNNSVAIMSQELCLITVDTASSYPKIIWEESGLQGIASSTIFRESSVTGVWDSLATIPVTSLSEYIDSTANTLIKKWSYRISANDSCDNRRISTASHSTMHLQIYPGINGYMNLSWTIATGYQNNPVLNYYIYRDTGSGWAVLDSVSGSVLNYTDIGVPVGSFPQYFVEARKALSCTPLRNAIVPYQSSSSNISSVATSVHETEQHEVFSIYPNPAISNNNISIVNNSLINESVELIIIDITGKEVSKWSTSLPANYLLPELSPGLYTLRIVGKSGTYSSKLFIENQ